LALSGVLIGFNWGLYIWAVNAGHVVESSLGYFINPLLNVLLGVVVLRERLTRVQWTSVAIAFVGVAWLTLRFGQLPWIALALGGLVRAVWLDPQAGTCRLDSGAGHRGCLPLPPDRRVARCGARRTGRADSSTAVMARSRT
jgi:chloramphenicol-sensitive protein RarD